MRLKKYQQDALDALKSFLEKTRETHDAGLSFKEVTGSLDIGRYRSEYKPLIDMPEVPYACIRIPTGGGKTILGAHTVKLAGNSYLERDFPVALWLVPSNTIRTQTVEALKNRQHPYRKVLDDTFDGRVRVFDITEFPNIRPTDISDSACVVVSTIQTLRIANTEGRKVYGHHEALEPHFSRFSTWPKGLELDEKGTPKYSFANLLHLHSPLLIVDEAHNAVTGLTREMQTRINPACIIEFTATPKPMSNVLFSVSASVLKTEKMIKLPIVLTAHTSWQAAVSGALAERARLAEKAKNEPQYIRPIILFQAQNKDQEVTAEVLRQHLIENEQIPAERIAVVTGEQRELDSINLFDPNCPIEYVITIKALKEGWDCSFAYVFCSVANIRSATDVEQLLGRVLRMPYAESRREKILNSAYAHVCEPNFMQAALDLKDKLIEGMGFEAEEAEDNLQMPELDLQGGSAGPLYPTVSFELEAPPDLGAVPEDIKKLVKVEETGRGGAVVRVEEPVSEYAANVIASFAPEEKQAEIKRQFEFARHKAEFMKTPAAKNEPFPVPQLCLFVDGELEVAEPDLFLDFRSWNLLDYDAALTADEFGVEERFQSFEVDVEKEKVVYEHLAENKRQLELSGVDTVWDERSLTVWLDRQCRDSYINQTQRLEFIRRLVKDLTGRGFPIGALVRGKYRLAKAITLKISKYWEEAKEKGFQACLFKNEGGVETTFDYAFNFDGSLYHGSNYYRGSYKFKKHYFGAERISNLDNTGEEFECAQAIDMQEKIKYWVRNLESKPLLSFRLPLARGWFYPDFVALLKDGRVFVIEYKGAHLIHDPRTEQKNSIGQLWGEKSNGKALFLMAEKEKGGLGVYEQIRKKIG
ncbi:MAG: DEAD/DEAH box helicase family protein [Deltaproteobacteria bacterium]|nr:DEAD/DEAH box helicase family protein [Deltaproteobacteria bacterium]